MKKKLMTIVASIIALAVLMPCVFVPAEASEVGRVMGDINGDGVLTALDSLLILRFSVNLEKFDDSQIAAGDVNRDGVINAGDSLVTLRISVGISPERKKSENTGPYKDYALEMLDLINAERAKKKLPPLELDEKLCKAADVRAEDISYAEKLEHKRKDGSNWQTVLDEYNIEWMVNGECLGTGRTPQIMSDLWMNSNGHRKIMLDERYKKIGVGYYFNEDSVYGYYWSLDFTD